MEKLLIESLQKELNQKFLLNVRPNKIENLNTFKLLFTSFTKLHGHVPFLRPNNVLYINN